MTDASAARWAKIAAGLRLPAIVAPMFLVSGPKLVVASCREGLIGSFPTGYARTVADLRRWFTEIEAGLKGPGERAPAPYAANLIVHPTNTRVEEDLDLICEFKVPIVIASVGNPSRVVKRIHEYGGVVLSDISRVSHARKLLDSGVDGLILLCAGAGGHTGWMNPFAFVPAVREFYDGPLILAGSIADGKSIRAAQALGADLAYIGTRFIPTEESDAVPEYRKMIIESGPDQIILTPAVSGLPANWLLGSLKRLGYTNFKDPPPGEFSASDNIKAWRDIWGAGHAVGASRKIETVAAIVAQLEAEYRAARS